MKLIQFLGASWLFTLLAVTDVSVASAQSSSASIPVVKGWNLLGNGTSSSIPPGAIGKSTQATSIWKWDAVNASWSFYAPSLADGGAAYASSKGYGLLTSINPGEGYWVNASESFSLAVGSSPVYPSTKFNQGTITGALVTGWNLISVGDTITPSQFNTNIGFSTPASGVIPNNLTSLWAWDAANTKWLFYAPAIEAQGNSALTTYITSKGYEDFTAKGITLGMGLGFWVNTPAPVTTVMSSPNSGTGSGSTTSSLQAQVITLVAPSAFILNNPVTLNASSSSGLTVNITSNTPSICTVTGLSLTPIEIGTCTITVTQPGNSQYAEAGSIIQGFKVISNMPPLVPVITNIENLTMTVGNPALAVGSTTTIHSAGTPPVITSGPNVTNIQSSSATVTWITDKPSVAGLTWNDGTNHGSQTDTTLTTTHVKQIKGLSPGKSYNLSVSATDASGNGPTLSASKSFNTPAAINSASTVIHPDDRTMANCPMTEHLISAQDSQSWAGMSLTTATSLPACIKGFQDAGKYLVISATGIYDANNKYCDLVLITKSNGQTKCINLPLEKRSLTGNPSFYLGEKYFPTGAQLNPNGKFFYIPFQTNGWNSAYIGYLRLDFTGNTPTFKIAHLEYSSQVSQCNANPMLDGKTTLGLMYWTLANGNMAFQEDTILTCGEGLPFTSVAKYYYLDANNTNDPLQSLKYLYDQHNVSQTRQYGAYFTDQKNSPLGIWAAKSFPNASPINNGEVPIVFGGEVYPGSSSDSSDLSFYLALTGFNPGINSTCTGASSSVLIKAVVNPSTNTIEFNSYGVTSIGSGWGASPSTDNVILSQDGKSLITLRWQKDGSDVPKLQVVKLSRALDPLGCDVSSVIYTTKNPAPTIMNKGLVITSLPVTLKTSNYEYMFSYPANTWDGAFDCDKNNSLGCPIPSDAVVMTYKYDTEAVNEIPVFMLTSSTTPLYSNKFSTNFIADKIVSQLFDKSGSPFVITYSPTGISSSIQFPTGGTTNFSTSQGFLNFETPPVIGK